MSSTRRRFLRNTAAASALSFAPGLLRPQSTEADARIGIFPTEPIATIAPEIYSHFIEHLGGVIYDGVWVGRESKIANTGGIRTAFIDAMRAVKAPVLRWPGGCFADSYDWRDGIGPTRQRPQRAAFWGQQDSNQYGLHEFMPTCRAIGCKPYLAADIRTLPARDFYQGIEYCNAPGNVRTADTGGINALAALRAKNGRRSHSTSATGASVTRPGAAAANRRRKSTASFTAGSPRGSPRLLAMAAGLRLVAVGANGDDARLDAPAS